MRLLLLPLILLISQGCTINEQDADHGILIDAIFTMETAKWYHNHTAAVSITYDAAYAGNQTVENTVNEVLNRGLVMDFELITDNYDDGDMDEYLEIMREVLLPSGIHFFGHGHHHIEHDNLDFDSCLVEFSTCFNLMDAWGLNPKAYAYPGGNNFNETTYLACKMAGFICARGSTTHESLYYVCPDDIAEPDEWYNVYAVAMGVEHEEWTNNHEETSQILNTNLERNAWVIFLYHSIGLEGSYAWYPWADFLLDLDQIAANDFWCGNLDNVTCYVKERNLFECNITDVWQYGDGIIEYRLFPMDLLDDEVYDQPLTLNLTLKEGYLEYQHLEMIQLSDTTEYLIDDGSVSIDVLPNENSFILRFSQ